VRFDLLIRRPNLKLRQASLAGEVLGQCCRGDVLWPVEYDRSAGLLAIQIKEEEMISTRLYETERRASPCAGCLDLDGPPVRRVPIDALHGPARCQCYPEQFSSNRLSEIPDQIAVERKLQSRRRVVGAQLVSSLDKVGDSGRQLEMCHVAHCRRWSM